MRIALLAAALALASPASAAGVRKAADARTARVWYEDAAYSADPAEFDAGIHHIVFTPVQAWLVSNYRLGGGYQGELAERWTVSADSRTWTFLLRPDMTYENGERIKPEDLASCWTRLIRVLKAKGSRADAFADLDGYDDFPAKSDAISGISTDGRSLTLRFSKPQPKLLENLSFGIYALAHPSLYDHRTGGWFDPMKVIASGPYRVREWDARHVLLALRKEYRAELRHPRPFAAIDVRWDPEGRKDPDLVWTSLERPPAPQGYLFQGGEAPGVGYLRCQSALDPASPLFDPALRRVLRAAFYEEMAKSPIPVDKSFYPQDMKGIRDPSGPLSAAEAAVRAPKDAVLRYNDAGGSGSPRAKAVLKALQAAAERTGFRFTTVDVPWKDVVDQWRSTSTPSSFDIQWAGTRIDVNDPIGELHFMIETTEGVCLPDPSGRAHAALKRESAQAQEFNQILWDDAIIWTLYHSHGGWWRKPEVDFSMFDSRADVPAVSMMGWTQ